MEACYVFPGQGSQAVGMGKKLYDEKSASRSVFDTAEAELGFDIKSLMFEGSEEDLRKTLICQPAIFVCNMAHYAVLSRRVRPVVALGDSLAEYNALVAGGALSYRVALALVRKRAKYMSECIPNEPVKEGTFHMAAIRTENFKLVADACDACSLENSLVSIAKINSKDQIVIAGNNAAVVNTIDWLKGRGVRFVRYLEVEGPYHTKIMEPAAEKLRHDLEGVVEQPHFPVVTNHTATALFKPGKIEEAMANQVANVVNWKNSLEWVVNSGVRIFIECGHGNVQSRLISRGFKDKGVEVLRKEKYLE